LTVVRPPLASFTLSPNPVTGGLPVTGSVVLAEPAPAGGVTVTAFQDYRIFIPKGETTGFLSLYTQPVQTLVEREIPVSYAGQTLTARLVILPTGLKEMRLEPPRVTGGETARGTVVLSAPAPFGGITLPL